MSSVSHALARGRQEISRRLASVDPIRWALWAVAVGTMLAVVALVFGAIRPRRGAGPMLVYLLARSLPLLGALAVVAVVWFGSFGSIRSEPTALVNTRPETGLTSRTVTVEREDRWRLDAAAIGRYHGRANESATEIHGRLAEGAIRALCSRGGLDAERAREAVRDGTWTDDPIAGAFLGDPDRVRLPTVEWLRGLVDPGRAYRRRVRRTLDAIESLEDAPHGHETDRIGEARR